MKCSIVKEKNYSFFCFRCLCSLPKIMKHEQFVRMQHNYFCGNYVMTKKRNVSLNLRVLIVGEERTVSLQVNQLLFFQKLFYLLNAKMYHIISICLHQFLYKRIFKLELSFGCFIFEHHFNLP